MTLPHALCQAHAALAALYAELDSQCEPARQRCRACGQCCHFDAVDHILYATELEVSYLRQGAAGVEPDAVPAGRCPYQRGATCRVHPWRPLGCRLFFCQGQGPPAPGLAAAEEALSARLHAALRGLHTAHDLAWTYQPFLAQLAPPGCAPCDPH